MVNRRSAATAELGRGLPDASHLPGLSDGQLLARFAWQRDESAEVAFAALVHRHGPMVLRVCRQIVGDLHAAEDAFQATFLVLARRAGAVRRPELLGNWLHGVALRTAREARLRNDRRRRHELTGGEDLADSVPGKWDRPERAVADREELEVLHDEVSRLPERYRTAVVLCELEGLNYQEAALRMQCPVGTVGVRLRRARERLRVRLARRGLAPSAAILGALAGAEGASVGMPAALVSTTAEAAAVFASTGLASGSVGALARAALRNVATARLKSAARSLLAVGAGVALGWFAVREAIWQLTQLVHATTGPVIASPPPVAEASDVATGVGQRPTTAATTTPGRPTVAVPVPAVAAKLVSRVSGPDPRVESIGADRNARPQLAAVLVRQVPVPPLHVREERARGEALFAREWVRDDPAGHGGDGLGPVYNEKSCVACHGLASPGGAGPVNQNVVILTAVSDRGKPPAGLDRVHPGFRDSQSIVLHRFGTHPDYAAWRNQFGNRGAVIESEPAPAPPGETVEQRIERIRQHTRQGGRPRARTLLVQSRGFIRMTLSERNSPALFGAGQIDGIPSDVLVALAESQPAQVRGRVGRTSRGAVGRFGWKAQVASLHEFVRGACASELGLEVPGHAQAVSPVGPLAEAGVVDMTQAECDALVAYVRSLPAPSVVYPPEPEASRDLIEGSERFASVGCAECHRPTLGEVRGIYSDLLLHRMGVDLDDPGPGYGGEGRPVPLPDGPSPGEWRTPPLWGFRDTAPYLHDGRASNLEQAVALHGGQGADSAHKYFSLPARERAKVEAFLNSLVSRPRAETPVVVRATEQESVIDADAAGEAEVLVRRRRQTDVAREERRSEVIERHKQDEAAAKRVRAELPIAFKLETLGKTRDALGFYRHIARISPDSQEGRQAHGRIIELTGGRESP
jgi:RNA polymerase sigma factor (sigma-70 family)